MQPFSTVGFVSGAFFVLSNVSSYVALHLLDNISVATGVWCGTAMVVSFAFGAATDGLTHGAVAVVAIAVMIAAVWGITRTQEGGVLCALRTPLTSSFYS